ncbi:MAG TPA: hypothetical protein VKX96_03465, partial [Chloroflexota bacterium]|nr:hypothetical protein [Chloroflexota bacterium]
GVQRLDNSVPLIQDRRTMVRMYVQSDGPAVPGVTAYLYGSADGCASTPYGPLVPINPVGTSLTVQPSPNRDDINQSFLFELPWSWTEISNLSLCGVLNPYQLPLQQSYANNQVNAGPFNFQPSPRLQVQFIAYGYVLNNQTFYPRFVKDILQTYSWLRRVYPLASQPGYFSDPGPGLRTNLWFIGDDQLGSRVNQTDPSCNGQGNLCASGYVINQLGALRTENGASANTVYYGMISDAAGDFPRGQDDSKNAAGPTGSGNWGWDYDGSYADWYAGHEIGHAVGRAHPSASAATCKNSASDPNYPYTGGQIGPSDSSPGGSTLEGFDVGDPDPSINLPMAVYPGASWFDVMSYCSNIWISDYTYTGMYNYMIANPPSPARSTVQSNPGDWLTAFGVIYPNVPTAILNHVRRLPSVASIPTRNPGPYSIRLLNGSGTVLADYPFTPFTLNATDPALLGFGQVVPFVSGTALVRVVRVSDGAVLTSIPVGTSPPTVSGVALQGAPNPVSGTVTLRWNASVPGGGPMSFDVLYSRDGGATFQPIQGNLTSSSVQIDTSRLGGGTTSLFRVIATAGVQTGQADSPLFTMANKPPQPHIITPGNGAQFRYGQIINLAGEADDFQDSGVAPSGLAWSSDKSGSLGTGSLVTLSNLPVGQSVITLTATDSAGLQAQTSVTITVGDDLSLPGPTLSVGPTQIVWHVADGVTTKQTAQLIIGNAGGGSLTWTASANVPWISLSASSGSTPATITVTGDPSTIAPDTAASGAITLTGSNGQTVTVPVGMALGYVWANGNQPPVSRNVYLPLVAKSSAGGW